MSHRKFAHGSPWARYSKKLVHAIENPRHAGFFTSLDAESKGMRFVHVLLGSWKEGNLIELFLLIDESDSIIADARFQVFGQSVVIGALEALCRFLIRKTVSQMARLTADLLDHHLRDKADVPAFPQETFTHLNFVLDGVYQAVEQCQDLMKELDPSTTPLAENGVESEGYPGWELLSKEEKIAVIEGIVASDIRPYIELDAGGIQIVDLVGNELIIAYEGACTTCYSSTGATLHAIQGIVKAKAHNDLIVVPDPSVFR